MISTHKIIDASGVECKIFGWNHALRALSGGWGDFSSLGGGDFTKIILM